MPIYPIKHRKNIVLGIIIALGLFLAYALKDVFTAILGAIILYTLFKPLYIFFSAKKKWNKSLSAISIIIISFLIIVLPFISLSWMIVEKIIIFKNNPQEINIIINKISQFLKIKLDNPDFIDVVISNIEGWALETFASVVNGVLGAFLKIFIMYFVLYFMLKDHAQFETTILKYFPFGEKRTMEFATELKNITYSNVLGQGIISIIQGLMISFGFFIFGISDPIFWGIICIFLSFLPVVGSGLIFVPAGIIAMASGRIGAGIGIILWGFILVANIDNFLRFIIAKRFANAHPLITIIGVVIGIPFFGILGLVIGPLLLSYFILLVKIYEARYVKSAQENPIAITNERMIKPNNPAE